MTAAAAPSWSGVTRVAGRNSPSWAPCKNEPPAPPFVCPATLPADGSACGICIESCQYDTCTPDGGGSNIAAQCNGGKWTSYDVGCLQCCSSDSDCTNAECAGSRCESLAGNAGCYRDADCGAGMICGGAQICHCGSPCPWVDQPGVCVPDNQGCCGSNDDCKDKEVCVAGVCKPPLSADDSCWSNRDCVAGGLPCGSASVCPCGSECILADAPGKCLIPL